MGPKVVVAVAVVVWGLGSLRHLGFLLEGHGVNSLLDSARFRASRVAYDGGLFPWSFLSCVVGVVSVVRRWDMSVARCVVVASVACRVGWGVTNPGCIHMHVTTIMPRMSCNSVAVWSATESPALSLVL